MQLGKLQGGAPGLHKLRTCLSGSDTESQPRERAWEESREEVPRNNDTSYAVVGIGVKSGQGIKTQVGQNLGTMDRFPPEPGKSFFRTED